MELTMETIGKVSRLKEEVAKELYDAMSKHNSMYSAHEGYSVILEEMDELWDEVKSNPIKNIHKMERMREEAVQVAAMACRFIIDVCDKEKLL